MILVYSIVGNDEGVHAVEELHAVCNDEQDADAAVAQAKKDFPKRDVIQRNVAINLYSKNNLLD